MAESNQLTRENILLGLSQINDFLKEREVERKGGDKAGDRGLLRK